MTKKFELLDLLWIDGNCDFLVEELGWGSKINKLIVRREESKVGVVKKYIRISGAVSIAANQNICALPWLT